MDSKPGDFILYPANGNSRLSSRLVAAGEMIAGLGDGLQQYSHAAILSDIADHQYEATFPKTCHSKIDTTRTYEVWNVGDPTDDQRAAILRWCQCHVGNWYNLTGVLTMNLIRLPGTYYCSQFACLAYADAGIIAGDSIMSPDSVPDFVNARLVRRIYPTSM